MKKQTAQQPKYSVEALLEVRAEYQAEVRWFWTTECLHDTDYHIKVWDSLDRVVKRLEDKYDAQDDTSYRCQFDGRMLIGDRRDQVEAAGLELARHLRRFKGIVPLFGEPAPRPQGPGRRTVPRTAVRSTGTRHDV